MGERGREREREREREKVRRESPTHIGTVPPAKRRYVRSKGSWKRTHLPATEFPVAGTRPNAPPSKLAHVAVQNNFLA